MINRRQWRVPRQLVLPGFCAFFLLVGLTVTGAAAYREAPVSDPNPDFPEARGNEVAQGTRTQNVEVPLLVEALTCKGIEAVVSPAEIEAAIFDAAIQGPSAEWYRIFDGRTGTREIAGLRASGKAYLLVGTLDGTPSGFRLRIEIRSARSEVLASQTREPHTVDQIKAEAFQAVPLVMETARLRMPGPPPPERRKTGGLILQFSPSPARVALKGPTPRTVERAETGDVVKGLKAGAYSVVLSADCQESSQVAVRVEPRQQTVVNIQLNPMQPLDLRKHTRAQWVDLIEPGGTVHARHPTDMILQCMPAGEYRIIEYQGDEKGPEHAFSHPAP